MTQTKKDHIDIIIQLTGKFQLSITKQILVNRMYWLASIATAMNKRNKYTRMVDQQTYEFATRITCSADYADLNCHYYLCLLHSKLKFGCRIFLKTLLHHHQ